MRVPRLSTLLQAAIALLLSACSAGGDVTRPIPVLSVPAAQPPHRLVVVLPGRADDLESLANRGIAQAIHQQWPDADVVLTGLTMPFYRQGRASERLHDEILAPARARHYDQVWLLGISLGGLGALLYDRTYPGQIDGLLLISPYLGDPPLYREIQAAGGLAQWQPGPERPLAADTFQRELWRSIQAWTTNPARARSVWVAYGDGERFRDRIALLAGQLPPDHVVSLQGHHNWKLWRPALRTLLLRASLEGSHAGSTAAPVRRESDGVR